MTQQDLTPLVCPVCHASLALAPTHITCTQCHRQYPIEDGLPILIPARATPPA